jgi:hypothetical protein
MKVTANGASTQLTPGTGHVFTRNPAGVTVTHANLGGDPLCGWITAGETAVADWSEVTCGDCQAARPPDAPVPLVTPARSPSPGMIAEAARPLAEARFSPEDVLLFPLPPETAAALAGAVEALQARGGAR